jgi:hypothetical protein
MALIPWKNAIGFGRKASAFVYPRSADPSFDDCITTTLGAARRGPKGVAKRRHLSQGEKQMKPFRCVILSFGLACLAAVPLVGWGDPPRRTPRVQEATITLTEKGYEPATVRLRRGIPARITFLRRFEVTCATEIILEEYNIRRELPINRPVVVEFTPVKSGVLEYSCSMKMVGGSFRIQ